VNLITQLSNGKTDLPALLVADINFTRWLRWMW